MIVQKSKWKLLEPIRVGKLLLRNRMVMAPMETMHNHADGSVSQDMVDYYAERARGGIGLIIVQNSAVDIIASRSHYAQLSVNSDHLIPGLSKLADVCKLEGAAIAIQLGHGGRQTRPSCNPGVQPVAPSPVPMEVPGMPPGPMPKALTLEEIEMVQNAFANAARRAKMAGLDGLEIHGAHGYLIGEFISRKTNRRTDKYGGSLENRARFALEIIARVRAVVGEDFMVGFRMSADEYTPGGLTLDDAIPYAKLIAGAGVDYIHVSAGTYESRPHIFPVMYYGRGHLLHLAAVIKQAVTSVPIIAVGALDADTGEKALRDGKADLIAFGRGLLADPALPNKLASDKVEDIRPCILGNEGCTSRIGQGRPLRCEVNPAVGREVTFRMTPASKSKRVMVIGGGIAGMEAARTAALRGHDVTLVERSDQLGGHLIAASIPKFKSTIRELLSWAERQVSKGNIKVHLNTEATPALIKGAKPDVLIVAVGSTCKIPPVQGRDRPSVVSGIEVLLGQKRPGAEMVVVGGGTIGCEVALYATEELKRKVVIVEMLDDILTGHEPLNKMVIKERIQASDITIHTGWILREVTEKGVVCEDKNRQTHTVMADTTVLCTGLEARRDLVKEFEGLAPEVYAVGDCVEAHRIYNAFEDAWNAVLRT